MNSYFRGLTGSWTIYAAQKAGVSMGDAGFVCSKTFYEHDDDETRLTRNRVALNQVLRRHGEVAGIVGVSEGGDTFAAAFAQIDASAGDDLSQKVLGLPVEYWRSIIDRDPAPLYLSLDRPILLIHGGRDESDPVESAQWLAQRFEAEQKTNFRLLDLPEADHVLKQHGEDLKPQVMGEVAYFLRDHRGCVTRPTR
ncbi:MAG: alpha/beta hydrolase family protein [Betaproteobacteria bacterium]